MATPAAQLALAAAGHGHSISYPELPVRNARACNVVTFSDANPSLLAVGLDKVRTDYSVNIWDIEMAREMATDVLAASASPPITSPVGTQSSTTPHGSSLRDIDSAYCKVVLVLSLFLEIGAAII
jgi:hypothetical protein